MWDAMLGHVAWRGDRFSPSCLLNAVIRFVKPYPPLAMAAGVTGKLLEIDDIVALVEAEEAHVDRKRGPYKKTV